MTTPRRCFIALLLLGLALAGFAAWHARRRSPPGEGGERAAFPARQGGAGLRELEPDRESVTTEVNAKAPALAATSLDGERIRSIDFIGNKVVLLEFWSVFCSSCISEMPFLAQLHEKYR